MSDEVGRVALGLELTDSKLETQMNNMMGRIAKKAAAALAAVFSVKALTSFGKQCIELGSDLAEVQNVVDVTFPSMSAKVDEFAQSAAATFGLSETMAKKFTGTFGSMAEAFGFSEQAAYEMSTALTSLAGDVASFYNITQDEAYTKLKSVFSGETETLKDLGIVMTQSALDAYALANGYGKTTSAMTEMEKVSLRYAFVQDQLTNATGDFWRTQDSWANQSRVLALQAESAMAAVGQGLINLLTPALQLLNQVMGRVIAAAEAFRDLTAAFTGASGAGTQVAANLASADSSAASLGSNLGAAVGELTGLSGSTGSAAKGLGKASKAAQALQRSLEGFDQITKVSEDTGASGSSGGTGSGAGSGANNLGGTDLSALGTGAEAAEDSVSKLSGAFQKLVDFINGLNFAPLQAAWERLSSAAQKFGGILSGALSWGLENVLAPLAKWTVEKAAPALVDLLAAALEVLNSACEALAPAAQWIWDSFLEPIASWTGGVIVSVLEALTDALSGLSDWIGQHQTAFSNIVLAIGAFAAAFVAAQSIVGVITTIVGAFTVLRNAFSVFTFMQTAQGAIKAFQGAFGGFSIVQKVTGLFAGLNPVVLAVTAAIAAAVAVGVLLYKNWDTVCRWAEKLYAAIEPAVTLIRDNFAKALEHLQGPLDTIKEAFGRVKDAIANNLVPVSKEGLLPLWDLLKAALMTVATALGGAFAAALAVVTGVINGIVSAVSGFATAISGYVEVVTSVFDLIVGVISGDKDLCVEALNGILDGAVKVFGGLWSGVSGFLQGFVDGVVGFFQGLWDTLVGHSIVPDTINGVINCFGGLWDGVSGFVGSFVEGVTSAFASAKDWVVEKTTALKDGAVEAFRSLQEKAGTIWEGVKENVSNAASGAKEAASDAWSNLQKKTKTLFGSVEDVVEDSWSGIKSTASKATEGVKSTVSKAWTNVKTTTANLWTNVKTAVSTPVNTIKSTVSTGLNSAKSTVATVWNSVKSSTTSTWNAIKAAVSTPVNSIKGTISTGLNSAKSTVATVWNSVKSSTTSTWNAIKAAVSTPVNSIRSTISTGLSSAKSTVSSNLDSIKSKFSSTMSGAKDTVKSAISNMKSAFNFKWSLPTLKMPHFSIKGGFSLNPPSVPKFSISWYKKAMDNPMLLNKATIFGAAGGSLLGAGEAGPEVVAGAEKLKSMIAGAVQNAVASRGMTVDLSGYTQRNTPRLAAVTSSEPAEERRRRNANEASDSGKDLGDLEELLKEILKYLKSVDIVRFDPETARKYFIRKTNANTIANGGRCELLL